MSRNAHHQPTLDDNDKPPFRLPTMDEIRAVPWNRRTVISTFAGAGGSSTGYRWAGYRVLAAVEFVPAAADAYRANCQPWTTVIERDVRQVDPEELLDAAHLKPGQLDVLDGSPPCEAFSSAGKRDKSWGKEVAYSGQRQRIDNLFPEFARLVEGIQPRVFVAENVPGLARGRARGHFRQILHDLTNLGYRVQARQLDAQWLGVPQARQRIIFVGVREDLDQDPAHPDPLPYRYTVREALPHIWRVGTDPNFDRRRRDNLSVDQMTADSDRPAPTVSAAATGVKTAGASGANGYVDVDPEPRVTHGKYTDGVRAEKDISDTPSPTILTTHEGFYRVEHPADEMIVGNDAFEPRFGPPDVPSPTVTAEGARTSGEIRTRDNRVRRKFTIPELMVICGFPPDYQLPGTYAQQWERLGDSVPPPMMRAVAQTIHDRILKPAGRKAPPRPKPRTQRKETVK